jgi:uncharacterized protein YecT (DUF1311 family)
LALVLKPAPRIARRLCRVAAIVSFVGASGALGSAAGAASAPKPPVISENFTPLPCHKNTTLGMEGCAEAQLLQADKRLNRQVAIIFELFRTNSQKRQFVTAETSWFAFRGKDCQSFSDIFEGGSLVPVDYADCEVRDDTARSTDLHSFYGELTQGDSMNVPTWP